MQWLVLIKPGPRKDHQWTADRVKGQGLAVWFDPTNKAAVAQTPKKGYAGYDRKVSAHTVRHSLLGIGLCRCRLVQECTFWPLSPAENAENCHVHIKSEPLGYRRRCSLMNDIFFYMVYTLQYVCVAKLGWRRHQDSGQCSARKLWVLHSCGCYFDT